jgi:hypothetical protein
MSAGELLLHGAVWLSLTAWTFGSALWTVDRPNPGQDAHDEMTRPVRSQRFWWTLGAFSLAVHFVLAMQLRHHWSHAEAVADTARQTHAKFGLNWGGGVWFNYTLIAVWLADAAWSWVAPAQWRAALVPHRILQGYLFFMWCNGAVVFAAGPVRWFGLVACGHVVWSWWRPRRSAF